MMDQYHTCLRIDTTVKKTLVPFPLFSFLADLIGFQECAMYFSLLTFYTITLACLIQRIGQSYY